MDRHFSMECVVCGAGFHGKTHDVCSKCRLEESRKRPRHRQIHAMRMKARPLSRAEAKPGATGFAMIDDRGREVDSTTFLRSIFAGRRFA